MATTRDPYRFKASDWRNASQWRKWELVGLQPTLDLTDLVLNWTDKRVTDLEARGAITSIELERTIEAASTLTIVLRDPGARIFSTWAKRMRPRVQPLAARRQPAEVDEGWEPLLGPELIGKAMQVTLDGATFRLVAVAYNHADEEVTLTFEDRIVYLLRRKRGERRASRAKVTRAQFVLSLLREIKLIRPPFICPELTRRQPIDKPDTGTSSQRALPRQSTMALRAASSNGATTSSGDTDATGGFAAGASLTVKGKPASAAQRRRMEGILTEAQRLGCSADVMACCLGCAIQESVMGETAHQTGNDDVGLMQQGRNWIPAADTMNPQLVTNAFLLSGTPQAKGKGTAPGWLKKHGSLKAMPGGFNNAIKAVQVSVGGYGPWEAESKRAVKAWGGSPSAESDAAGDGSYVKSYQFAREPEEDSWTAIQRLAEEVGWRCFVVGSAVYFMSDEQLFRRRPRYEITAQSDLLLDLRYDVDWGKTVSEATLTVALDRWGAPPGSVMLLSGFGPPDGRWLVTSVRRDWFEPTAEVTIKQPGKQKLEPASERASRAGAAVEGGGSGNGGSADSSATGRCYAEAKAISDKGYPYIWGGGHGAGQVGKANAGTNTPSKNSGPPPGFDCSGYVCAILAAGGLGFKPGGSAMASGGLMSWGVAGEGERLTVWANGGHTFIEFKGMGSGKFADTGRNAAPPADRGPRLRSGTRSTAGFVARHWRGT